MRNDPFNNSKGDLCVNSEVKHKGGNKKVAVIHMKFVLKQQAHNVFFSFQDTVSFITIKCMICTVMLANVLSLCLLQVDSCL